MMKMGCEPGVTRRHAAQESGGLQSNAMERLCERPGCSEPSAVAYGMRPEDLVFWLDVLDNVDDLTTGVLCLRHADAMVVPRNWTLDDHRDPDLHLFRPPSESVDRRRSARRPPRPSAGNEQLEFGVEPTARDAAADATATATDAPATDAEIDNWIPDFDDADDLDGLLSAQSPLLARAFRGADRPTH